ncbi:MAG TPA: ComEC/Rec2 family competence protein, partial [Candidatus Krumholzibacteria bacterium]|nr:ComEC/Rec2 family competence protein [Candidatus Krumholzibacteria bacterium]
GTRFEFATRVGGRRVRLQVRAEAFDVAYGDRYRLRARVMAPPETTLWALSARGLAGDVRVRLCDMERAGHGGNSLFRDGFWPLHRFARTRLQRVMGADAGLAVSLLLGERAGLGDTTRDAVRRLGITHLLAISGMHLTTMAGCVLLLARRAPRWRSWLLAGALTLYAGMVGSIASLSRAYLMAMLMLGAHAIVRPVRPRDALAVALLIMSVSRPLALRAAGLQLSFAATFAVLMVLPELWRPRATDTPRVRRLANDAARSVRSAFVLSLAVELFIAPLQLHHFHAVSAVGAIATVLFFVPVSLVLLGAAPVAVLAACVPGREWPGVPLRLLSVLTTHAMTAGGRVAPGLLVLPEPNLWLYYGGLALAWRMRRRRGAWLPGAVMAVAAFVIPRG